MKKRVAFALLMGIITTGIISISLIVVNTNFTGKTLLFAWLKSWGIAYVIVIPCILFISPLVEKILNKLIKG